eukprot:GHRR01032138.1.p1 GENE.GHRR01032138.1~~GHRR01032138.1.p1  ORF type:complete len:183 (+),score=39.25 GHRR01032138.1:817-1365(+)
MQSALFQWRLCRDASACNASPGALELSLADYNAVLHLEQHNIDALYYRGTVFEKLGRLDEAISDFTAVLTLDPNHIKASYARGACRNLQGDFASAIGAQFTVATRFVLLGSHSWPVRHCSGMLGVTKCTAALCSQQKCTANFACCAVTWCTMVSPTHCIWSSAGSPCKVQSSPPFCWQTCVA